MKIYLAARYSRRAEMEHVAEQLIDCGLDVVSQWVYGKEETIQNNEVAALMDLYDVQRCDMIISFIEPNGSHNQGGGRHTEFGIALALNKQLVCIGKEPEQIFHYLPGVEFYNDIEEFLDGYFFTY